MNRQERRHLTKLRRRINLMVILCLLLSIWIKYLYSDILDYKVENDIEVQKNIQSDIKIKNLSNQIDSLKKEVIKVSTIKVETPPVVKKKPIIKIDTTTIKLKTDTFPIDSTNK